MADFRAKAKDFKTLNLSPLFSTMQNLSIKSLKITEKNIESQSDSDSGFPEGLVELRGF